MVVFLRLSLGAWIAASLTGIGFGAEPVMVFPGEDWVEAAPESQGVDSTKLEEAMEVLAELGEDHKNGTPHAGNRRSVVIRYGRMIWKGTEIDEVTPIHSCTKSLTSSVFGLLADDGLCAPSTLAADVYPALKTHYSTVRLGDLANLTSGYSIPWKEPWQVLRPPDFPPGSAMHYNGQGHMLSYLFQRLSGKKTGEIWREGIARPVGIPDDAWKWNEVGEIEGVAVSGGAAGMEITARQIARFGHLYLNGGLWAGRRVLSEDWVEMSTVSQVPSHTRCFQRDDIWYSVMPGRYGYNWWLNGIGADGKRFWPSAPDGTFFAQGNLNNHCIVVPEWGLVMVHLDVGAAIDSRSYERVFAILKEAVEDRE